MGFESYIDSEATAEYLKVLQNLYGNTEIVSWKLTRSLEQAKALSIDSKFHNAIYKIRKRYNISPQLKEGAFDPYILLDKRTSHLSDEDRELLNKDLGDLAKRFDLDWDKENESDDFGLIVVALCYGLTPDNILNHWDEMKHTIAKTRTPGIRVISDSGHRLKQYLTSLLVIAYTFRQLWDLGIKVELPKPILDMVVTAMKLFGKVNKPEVALRVIESIQKAEFPVELHLRIERSTTLEDIRRTWPQIELRKIEYLKKEEKHKSKKRKRIWRTYTRDIFIWQRVHRDRITYEKAYEEWLSNNPEDDPVEITAVIKAVNRIKYMPDEN